ncbi:MAG: NADH-quinone oxidoreductase subunit N [Deltaproteobacteria bacterium]|nr:MAG: NADH-quinone oxidoreductase subunit N [Deltaproteobacteria bacterium]
MLDNVQSVKFFLPELILTGAILVLIVYHVVTGKKKSLFAGYLTVVSVGAAMLIAGGIGSGGARDLFFGMVRIDEFSTFFKVIFSLATIFAAFMSIASSEVNGRRQTEYYVFLLSVTLGMYLLASATDLVMVYLSLELVSIPSYLLAGYLKRADDSVEGAVKYVVYGATASGIMIYGFSLLYGLTGTTSVAEIGRIVASGVSPLTLTVAFILVGVGFGYKIAAVPFHMWSPDVYEGAPTPVTAFLSVGPKAAGFAVLIRFFYAVFAQRVEGGQWALFEGVDWVTVFAVLSAVTMTVGNLVAIVQRNVKRLLAYSSIAHAGYMLMGFVLLNVEGLRAILFYLVVYLFMNTGAFLVVVLIANQIGSEDIEDYSGMGIRSPFLSVCMGIFLFALTGIPPFSGFIGKVYLFAGVIHSGLYWLAVIGVLNSVVSLYYYARILKVMFLEKPKSEEELPVGIYAKAFLAVLAFPTLLLGIYWEPIIRAAEASARLLGG